MEGGLGAFLPHPDIRVQDSSFYSEDGIHLSEKGNAIFPEQSAAGALFSLGLLCGGGISLSRDLTLLWQKFGSGVCLTIEHHFSIPCWRGRARQLQELVMGNHSWSGFADCQWHPDKDLHPGCAAWGLEQCRGHIPCWAGKSPMIGAHTKSRCSPSSPHK